MRILVLGNSDTRGEFAPAPTWTQVARERLNADGADYEFVERAFSPLGDAATAFADRLLSEHAPDLVVLPLGTFLFTVGFTWPRVQRVFGRRIANRYRKAEEAFDTKTRPTGAPPGRLNSLGRKAARGVLGTQPILGRQQLEESYARVLQSLARHEDVQVLLVAYPPERGRMVRVRRIESERALFLREVGADAARRHFGLLDAAPLFASREGEPDLMTADGFHLERAGHQLLGEALAAAIVCVGRDAAPSRVSDSREDQGRPTRP